MPFALLFNNRVLQIEDEKFDVASGLEWVEIANGQEVKDDYVYEDDKFVPKIQSTEYKQDLVSLINKQLNEYIFSKYDIGTLFFFVLLYIGPKATVEIKAELEKLADWGMTVMEYYYIAKAAVLVGTPLDKSNWDLSQFDVTDPKISLPELLKGQ